MAKLSLAEAQAKAEAVLMTHKTSAANAKSVATALVSAQADGLGTHGLLRLANYAAQANCGKVDGFAIPTLNQTAPSALIVDAANGFAYPAIDLAITALVPVALAQGIAAASITRSGHCGAMGLAVERIAERGMIAIMFANAPAAMAPWGGQTPLMGTNPIASAFPRPASPPVVIDLSLSKVARGNVVAAAQQGAAIPDDWALDVDGKPTTDAKAALAGTMLPLGGAKGAALALMVEAMAAGLTGSHFAFEASSFLDAKGPPPATGQFIIAINPALFGPGVSYIERLFTMVAAEKGARLPGERRLANRQKAAQEGIEVQDSWFVGS
ncbi:MAG: sulfolactate dehydrogenase [Acidocella sp. 20-57-95]|nr:MAG: sulfolactate dehydrogenase [Acidocella sp. 20-57-95]OYV58026.1 MAG: sulfolactate dehydrogenase [Acidocella sp. 21-58-7]HQT64531.1 Ldh family oxidoreductase [Acidocella sp.]HQU04336.1 Ldh family oxidoreductase [Acidocella sp.]